MMSFYDFLNYFFPQKVEQQKCLADSKAVKPDNFWKQFSFRKDEPEFPTDIILQEEKFLLDHKWEHVMTEEEGCDTWSYPWELRKSWPHPHNKSTQHYWDRCDAVNLQKAINETSDVQKNINFVKSQPATSVVKSVRLNWEPCCCVETIDDDKIRELAYFKWEAAGRPEGDGSYFWGLAEQELRSKG